jgi:hypothetical protein
MDFETLLIDLTDFYYHHTMVTIGLAVVLLLLVCCRPKAMFKTAGILLAFAVAVYFFTLFIDMGESGRAHKKEMVHTVR